MRARFGRGTLIGGVATAVVVLLGVAAVTAAGIAGWEYSNSNAFCANMCHQVHPEEPRAHAASAHARVDCVECHMGRLSTLHLMALKPTHFKELWGMIAGYERPITSSTLRPARDHCESCHWPAAVHRDSIALKKRYATDVASTESATRLTLHTSAGVLREKTATGIHWHVENDVSFVSPDPQRREIPWVQVKKPDGTTVTYVDKTSKIPVDQIKKTEARRMECFDCHNAVGHPFPNPENAVDDAIADGKIDRSLPGAKARAVELVNATVNLHGTRAELDAAIDKLIAAQAAKAKTAPADKEKEAKFAREMKRILGNSVFEDKHVTWKTFPDHAAHKDFPGCFRCHDGKHFNEKGEAIRLQCTLCHDLPQVRIENGKSTVASVVAPGLTPPGSHSEPNFMHDHRTKLDQSCTMCHGKLEFGREGGNFCANPACHGRTWPEVNLNVKPAG
jgi:hypothetical protein